MSTTRRLGIEFYGDASGYLSAVNRVLYGTHRVAQGMRNAGNDAGYMSNQMKAVGTTMRYALAGGVVFGITSAIGRLREFKNELGSINAIAGELDAQGKFHGLGNELQDLGSTALQTSNEFGVATANIEAYMQRFFSSFDVTGSRKERLKEVRDWAREITGLEVTLGKEAGDPDVLAGGIAGFINAIPGGTQDISGNTERIANLIAFLTQRTPNITGRNIANDIGRIGSTMHLTGMTPEQAFATWTLAGKSGGSAAVIGRGITQLMGASLLNPNSPEQKAAFTRAVGTSDPSQLRAMGGFEVLKKLLDYVGKQNVGRPGNLEQFNTEEDLDRALMDQGLNKGGLSQLYALFGRQESVRQFINLLGEGGSKALDEFVKSIETAKDANLQQQRVQAAMSQRGLAVFAESWQNLNLSLVRSMEFPLESIGRVVKTLSDQAAGHRTTTAVLTTSAATLYASRLLGRLGAFNKINTRLGAAEEIAGAGGLSGRLRFAKGAMRLLSGASTVERAAVETALMAEATPNVVGGTQTDGTRANPFWVIIHPYSNYVGVHGGDPSMRPPGGGGPSVPIVAGRFGGLGRFAPFAKVAGLFGTAAIFEHQFGLDTKVGGLFTPDRWHGKKGWHNLWDDAFGGKNETFQKMLANEAGHPSRGVTQHVVHGTAHVTVQGDIKDAHGNVVGTIRKQGVPVRLWPAGNKFPLAKGNLGTRKASTP